jgi:ABC-type transport system involved in cytochrome bd biosynthesis fused ATPase/permease subunit
MRLIQSRLEDRESRTFRGQQARLREGCAPSARRRARAQLRFLDGLSIASCLARCELVVAGVLTPGDLIVFITISKNRSPESAVREACEPGGEAVAAVERVVAILETTPEIEDTPKAKEAPPLGHDPLEQVHFTYGGRKVLDCLENLAVRPPRIALLGASGAASRPSRASCSGSTSPWTAASSSTIWMPGSPPRLAAPADRRGAAEAALRPRIRRT